MRCKNYEEFGYRHDFDLRIFSHTKCVFHILQEVGVERKVSDEDSLTFLTWENAGRGAAEA